MSSLREAIYTMVTQIPKGCVSTYGDIARFAGAPGHARQVGYAMHDLPQGSQVPWHRVVNAQGAVSLRASGHEDLQRKLLEAEGVEFKLNGTLDLKRYRWDPDNT